MVSVGALAIIPERLCNTQKSDSTHNVSVSEGTWIFNRTVYVALCCKVNNVIRMIGLKQLSQSLFIPNIYMSKGIARVLIIFREVLKVACIRQSIHVQDMNVLISSKHIVDKVRSNKSSSTSYQIGLHTNLFLPSKDMLQEPPAKASYNFQWYSQDDRLPKMNTQGEKRFLGASLSTEQKLPYEPYSQDCCQP